jgi:hypothetical protein
MGGFFSLKSYTLTSCLLPVRLLPVRRELGAKQASYFTEGKKGRKTPFRQCLSGCDASLPEQ